MAKSYYVRYRGRTTGPFPADELKRMVKRGQVSPLHRISSDGQTWVRVSDRIKPQAAKARAKPEAATEPARTEAAAVGGSGQPDDTPARTAPPADEAQWFYSVDDSRVGPIPESVMKQMVAKQKLPDDTVVWTEGMSDWLMIDDVPRLVDAFVEVAPPRARPRPANAQRKRDKIAANTSAMATVWIAATVLLTFHIPIVVEGETVWWWDALGSGIGSTGALSTLTLIFMVGSAVALCIVPLVSARRAAATTALVLGGVGYGLIAIGMVSEGEPEVLLLLAMFASVFLLRGIARARLAGVTSDGARLSQGITAGVAGGAALITCLWMLLESDGPVPSEYADDLVGGAVLIWLGFAGVVAAAVCGLCNLTPEFKPGLNRAVDYATLAAAGAMCLGVTVILGAVVDAMYAFGGVDSLAAQVYLFLFRILVIFFGQLAFVELGLFGLLVPMASGVRRASSTKGRQRARH